jgi:hypothetical protein
MSDADASRHGPHSRVRRPRRISIIWLVPILAVAIGRGWPTTPDDYLLGAKAGTVRNSSRNPPETRFFAFSCSHHSDGWCPNLTMLETAWGASPAQPCA